MDWHTVHSDSGVRGAGAAPHQLRGLWRVERRKQFGCQIITAAIYKHLHGQELRVFIQPEDRNDLLHSELARFDFMLLEEKASSLREVL